MCSGHPENLDYHRRPSRLLYLADLYDSQAAWKYLFFTANIAQETQCGLGAFFHGFVGCCFCCFGVFVEHSNLVSACRAKKRA